MQSFPLGQCGMVTRLLGAYLEDLHLGTFDYITGGRIDPDERDKEPRSHAWLHKDGLIVDVTADQFEDQPSPVIVTRDASWHEAFDQDLENYGPASFRNSSRLEYDGAIYSTILDRIQPEHI